MDRRIVATLISLINTLLDSKNTKDAYDYMSQAQIIANNNNFESDKAKVLRLYGRAYKIDGDIDKSNNNYSASYELFNRINREKDADSVKKEWESLS